MRFRAGNSTTMPRSSGSMPRSRRHWIIGLPSCPPSRRRVSKGHCPRARFFKPSGRGGAFAPPPRSGMRTPSPTGAYSSRDRQERRRCLSPHTPRTTMSGGSRFQVPTGRQSLRSCWFLPGRLRIRRSPLPSSRAGPFSASGIPGASGTAFLLPAGIFAFPLPGRCCSDYSITDAASERLIEVQARIAPPAQRRKSPRTPPSRHPQSRASILPIRRTNAARLQSPPRSAASVM